VPTISVVMIGSGRFGWMIHTASPITANAASPLAQTPNRPAWGVFHKPVKKKSAPVCSTRDVSIFDWSVSGTICPTAMAA
jgi:hypothetical protein